MYCWGFTWKILLVCIQFSSVQSLSRVWLFATPWTAARHAFLSIINSQRLLKLKSIESVMPSNHLILCHPLLLPSIFPSIRIFSNESFVHIKWPKYWSCSFTISPSMNIQDWFALEWTGWISLQSKGHSSLLQHHSSKVSILRHPAFFFFYCSGFCHTLTWISHGFTCIPHPYPPSHLPLHLIPLGLPSAPGPSACLMHPTWAGDLFHPR